MSGTSEQEQSIASAGFALFPQVVPGELLDSIRADVFRCQQNCRNVRIKNGLDGRMDGSAHHIVGGGDGLNRFLFSLYLDEQISSYFGGNYILNSFGAIENLPQTQAESGYEHGLRFHRDVRTYSGSFRLMLNMLVMVDEFTPENGATLIVPGSHRREERPAESELLQRSKQICGLAGSILLFDSNLWHAAAPNRTERSRMALTLTFTRPFFKQQMDYPRLLGESFPPNERIRQILGYNARVPANLDEWYQPLEKRMYKPGQG